MSRFLGLGVAALGILVLVGWMVNSAPLKTVFPDLVSMKANTAVCFLATGMGLMILSSSTLNSAGRSCVMFLGLIAIIVGGLTTCEYVCGWDFGLDNLLFRDDVYLPGISIPGRMSPTTAFSFVLVGISFCVWAGVTLPASMRTPTCEALALVVLIIGGVALTGYTIASFYGERWFNFTALALHTALGFALAGSGLLCLARAGDDTQWHLGRVPTSGFVLGIASLIVAGGMSYYYVTQLRESASSIEGAHEILKKIAELNSDSYALASAQRSFVNTGDDHWLKQENELKTAVRKDATVLGRLIPAKSKQRQLFNQLAPLIEQRIAYGDSTVTARRQGGLAAAEQLIAEGEGLTLSGTVRDTINGLQDLEYALLGAAQAREKATATTVFLLLPLSAFISVAMLSIGLFFLNAEMKERHTAEGGVARLAAIVESSEDAVVGKDLNGIVTSWNKGAERIFGYTAEEMIGQPILRIIPPERHAEEADILDRIRGGRCVTHLDTERVRKDGSVVPISVTVSPIKDARGKIIGVSKTARDISERLRAEKALRDAKEDLERKVAERTAELQLAKERAEAAGRAKSQFLASMSHELRTPLNGIIGFSEFLIDEKPGPLNAKQKEYLEDVLTSGRHLLELINDVLDLAKVEAGRLEVNPEKFQLRKAISEVCSVTGAMARKKSIQVETSVSPELNGVTLDPIKFKQVIYNLLSNALKFTDSGGHVDIVCAPDGRDRFTLSVKDTGIGIKPQDQHRLFREFEQIDSGSGRRYEGTGLGLALTRRLVELQGGAIVVESEPGKGSTFTVTLPVSVPEANG